MHKIYIAIVDPGYPYDNIQGAVSKKMSQVFQVLEVIEIWICHIFGFFSPPKVTSTFRKQPTDRDSDGNNNKFYLKIPINLYSLAHVIRRRYGS